MSLPLKAFDIRLESSTVCWAFLEVRPMPTEIIGMAEAGRRLGISTREVVQLVYDGALEYVLVDRVPMLSAAVVEQYRQEHQKAS